MSNRIASRDVWAITRGDGSERCLVCGLRHNSYSYYLAEMKWGGSFPDSVGRPVCSFIHAQMLLAGEHPRMEIPYDQDVRLDK